MKTNEEKEHHTFIVSEAGIPWEIGPGFLKMVGAAEPKDDESRARMTMTILSGAESITEEEALQIRAERNAEARQLREEAAREEKELKPGKETT
jgi:hypothetical protein